jgi:hypothetical protein
VSRLLHAEGARHEADAAAALLEGRAERVARHAAGRDRLRGTMAANSRERGARLERDAAVHEALLKRKVCVGE